MGICNAIGKVDKPLVNYLIRSGSQTTSMNKNVFDIFRVARGSLFLLCES